jgi:DNA-binding response OmpR family regulator
MPHVLVVDDAPEICEALCTAFNLRGGWHATSARTPDDAVAMIERDRPDVAIVEAALRQRSGMLLAEEIVNRGVPVLLMSGEPDTLRRLERVRCAHLQKPFHLEELIAETRALLAESQERMAAFAALLRSLAATRSERRASLG